VSQRKITLGGRDGEKVKNHCSRTSVNCSLHKRATLLLRQKCSQLTTLETCSALMSSVLQSPSKPVQNLWKCKMLLRQKIVDELELHGISGTKNAGCSILTKSLTCINLPSTLEPVGLTNDTKVKLAESPLSGHFKKSPYHKYKNTIISTKTRQSRSGQDNVQEKKAGNKTVCETQ